MDDTSFEQWSEALADLRREREGTLDKQQRSMGAEFTPEEYFGICRASLEKILAKWTNFEQNSWKNRPPKDQKAAVEELKGELNAVLEFELEAVGRNLIGLQRRTNWSEVILKEPQSQFQSFSNNLLSTYEIKIGDLSEAREKPAGAAPAAKAPKKRAPLPRQTSGSSSVSSGTSVFTMFLVGLLLGSGAAGYFWDAGKKADKKHEEERAGLLANIRSLEDNLAMYQDAFTGMATGKMRRAVDIEKEIKPIRNRYNAQRKKLGRDFSRKKENLLRRVPAGDRLDRSLKSLEKWRNKELAAINAREERKLTPLMKELDYIKALMNIE